MFNRKELYATPEYWLEIIQNEIYSQVLKYMEKENLNKSGLAKRLGVNRSYITQILNGDINFSLKKLIELSLKINVVPDIKFKSISNYIQEEENRLLAREGLNGQFTIETDESFMRLNSFGSKSLPFNSQEIIPLTSEPQTNEVSINYAKSA